MMMMMSVSEKSDGRESWMVVDFVCMYIELVVW